MTIKKLLEGQTGRGTKIERPILTWTDAIEMDLINSGVKLGNQELWTGQNERLS
jgi:hypothetical protein